MTACFEESNALAVAILAECRRLVDLVSAAQWTDKAVQKTERTCRLTL